MSGLYVAVRMGLVFGLGGSPEYAIEDARKEASKHITGYDAAELKFETHPVTFDEGREVSAWLDEERAVYWTNAKPVMSAERAPEEDEPSVEWVERPLLVQLFELAMLSPFSAVAVLVAFGVSMSWIVEACRR